MNAARSRSARKSTWQTRLPAPLGSHESPTSSGWPSSEPGVGSEMRTRSGKRFQGSRSMSDQEMLDIVDDNDRVIRSAPRRLVLDEYHIHRAVIFFVFDREGSVFVNQRSASKEIY